MKKSPVFRQIWECTIGLVILPVCAAFTLVFYDQIGTISSPATRYSWYFFLGIGGYLFIHIFFPKLNWLYVLGHESMHALAAWITGCQVKGIKVSGKGGHVKADKNNLFIRLAPYLIPAYSLLVLVLFFIASLFVEVGPWQSTFFFLIGLTFCFHLIMTLEILKTEQTDLLESGYLFSMGLIYLVNLTILVIFLQSVTPQLSLLEYLKNSAGKTAEIYFLGYEKITGLF